MDRMNLNKGAVHTKMALKTKIKSFLLHRTALSGCLKCTSEGCIVHCVCVCVSFTLQYTLRIILLDKFLA